MIGYVFISMVGNENNKFEVMALTIFASFVLAFMINRYIEDKAKPLWKRFFKIMVGQPIQYLELLVARMPGRSKPVA